MAKIKSAADIARKWARVTPQRTQDYQEGVQNPTQDWEAATIKAEDNYKTGVQKAAAEGRFGKGVKKAGTAKWQKNTLEKGPNRFAEGVAVSEPEFQQGFEPFREVIAATQLPPRFPKGDPRNIDRVKVIAEALRKKKVA